MAENLRLICESSVLSDSGKGVRFELERHGESATAFVVRFNGRVYAYLNQCAHVSIELDWMEGEFFDDSGVYFICSTHGALYAPENGVCLAGPCVGKSLISIPVLEQDGKIHFLNQRDGYV